MSFPHQRLAADPHDRVALRRTDEAWLEQRWADPATRVLVVAGTRVRAVDGALDWVAPQDAPPGVRVLLGEQAGRAWFAVLADPAYAQAEPDLVRVRDLLAPLAAGTIADAPLLFHAIGLAEWHAATRFCPRCGGSLEPRKAGHELACTRCGRTQFPRTDPAVIMLITAGEPGAPDERCLLGRQAVWPEGRFSTLAGFCEPGESLEDAVRREVQEESGVLVGEVAYLGNQAWPFPASLMLGFVGRATSTEISLDQDDELEEARWFTRADLRSEVEAGRVQLPGGVSISRSLVEQWYGGPLPGQWGDR
ncbi:NAD(+) diphosphatase [Nocardioides pantholopis]|uniref:NAD(+) diphosphatase n=1 Tax=Nocardioides pantholopis TaxID=2483798 RepID=UPI000FD8FCE1|nr:NAD(+) diphosphatase [Nocardioides pantholopis]